ncbi:intracellular septation protein [Novimethylophilus kurashikiensis]|uniref:Inner membrane-spanning protein YciB n=1 Tax=Novimethylophilus kurashikiensis TaxID=1825523 RepID=A0A2R5F1T6_9PROT|nr:septation protein A [Novimethylophilus kurashikiensis]GBG12637.1 intracellular septation protein [Novimethylophilus kurashikiensis]
MKFLFDLFPVILFFAIFKLGGIFAATAAAIIATLCQIAWVKWRHGKVDGMLMASGIIVVVFGGATLLLHDETFIKWKPTVLYWMFAAILIVTELIWHKNLLRDMLQQQVQLPPPVWRNLNRAWAVFFALLGIANLYVAFHYPTNIWVNFKLFGATGLMIIFVLLQSVLLSKYVEDEEVK